MSELGEIFKDWKKIKDEKKHNNKKSSIEILNEKKVEYISNNGGIHLIISAPEGLIDFWPSTGLWKDRNNGITRRGVFSLLGFMGLK